MATSQVGVLIPLNKSFEKENSLPEFSISEGDNVIGRTTVAVTDRRLSRKHLVLSTSAHGSTNLLVEGMNPVVINSGGERKILSSGETATLKNGDILELIPGSHYFKYVALTDQRNSNAVSSGSKGATEHSVLAVGSKRVREDLITEASTGQSTVLPLDF